MDEPIISEPPNTLIKFCRCCLSRDEMLKTMTSETISIQGIEMKGLTVYDGYLMCSGLTNSYDEFAQTKNICVNCVQKLNSAYFFHMLCRKSNDILRENNGIFPDNIKKGEYDDDACILYNDGPASGDFSQVPGKKYGKFQRSNAKKNHKDPASVSATTFPLSKNDETYQKGGAADTLPGIVYQVKLSLLLLKHAIDNNYEFKIAVERKEADKFDDLEIEITCKNKHRLYQLKHILNETQTIKTSDLDKMDKSRFSLFKYFMSYRTITETLGPNSLPREYVIFTNVGLEIGLSKNFEKISDNDLRFKKISRENEEPKEPKRFKLKEKCSLKEKLILIFEKSSDIEQLIARLVDCVNRGEVIDFKNKSLKKYQKPLLSVVFDLKNQQFRPEFFDDNLLSPGALKLRKHLLNCENLKDKKLQIKECKDLRDPSEPSETIELPNDSIKSEEIEDFFSRLVFAVDQPNEIELSHIIEETIGKDFNLINNKFMANHMLVTMIDWTKEKDGTYLNTDSGKTIFDQLKEKVAKLYFLGLTLNHCATLESYNLDFKVELEAFREFLESKTLNFFHLYNPCNAVFSAVKVYNILKKTERFKCDDSYVFVPFQQLAGLRQHFLNAVKSCELAIIDFSNEKVRIDSEDEIFLRKILDRNTEKRKIVLIIPQIYSKNIKIDLDCSGLAEYGKTSSTPTPRYHAEFTDNANSLTDLEQDLQKTLLKNTFLLFQGKRVRMERIINYELKPFVTADLIVAMLQNQVIEFGTRLPDLTKMKKYHVRRTIRKIRIRIPKLNESPSPPFQVIDDEDVICKNPIHSDNVLLLTRTEEHFQQLCEQYPTKNIHWLSGNRDNEACFWVQSHGPDVSKLRELDVTFHPYYECPDDASSQRKIILIVAPAGMGKSTELTYQGIQMKNNDHLLLVMRINLVECSALLSKVSPEELADHTGAKNFLKKQLKSTKSIFIKGVELLEEKFFDQCIERGQVSLLFDGFDEIAPDYNVKVLELLITLSKFPVKQIWVTSRTSEPLKYLENKFMTLAYALAPLTRENVEHILTQIWSEHEKAQAHAYACRLIDRFDEYDIDTGLGTFLRSPLSVSICAKVFKKAFAPEDNPLKNFLLHGSDKKISVAELFYHFFESLFNDVYIGEKVPSLHDASQNKVHEKIIIKQLMSVEFSFHQKLALYAIFGRDLFIYLLPNEQFNLSKYLNKINIGEYKIQIIDRIVNNLPIFVHRSYAEYFVAHWLADEENWKNHKVVEVLKTHVLTNKRLIVKNFFLYLFAMNQSYQISFPVHVKVLQNDDKYFEELLATPTVAEKLRTSDKVFHFTPIQLAVHIENWILVNLLITAHNKQDNFLLFPKGFIFTAVNDSLNNIVKYIVEATDFDVNELSSSGKTLLHCASESQNIEIIKYLLKIDSINLYILNPKDTPVHTAVRAGNLEIVKMFLASDKFDKNTPNERGDTLVDYAIMRRQLAILQFLVEEVKMKVKIPIDRSPLHSNENDKPFYNNKNCEVDDNVLDVLKYLIETSKIDKNLQCSTGFTILHHAVRPEAIKVMKYLVEKAKVDTQILTGNGETPLHIALLNSTDLSIVRYLVEVAKVNVDVQDFEGCTALHIAVNHLEIIKYLVETANINTSLRTNRGSTPLHSCSINKNLIYLVEVAQINVNVQDSNGHTVLHNAVAKRLFENIKYLVETANIDTTLRTKTGKTPLHFAGNYDHDLISIRPYGENRDLNYEILKYLVDLKTIEINAKDENGQTVLHYASTKLRNFQSLKYLVEVGKIVINLKDDKGQTALHVAIECSITSQVSEIMQYLVKNSEIDTTLENVNGETARDVAKRLQRQDLFEYLDNNKPPGKRGQIEVGSGVPNAKIRTE